MSVFFNKAQGKTQGKRIIFDFVSKMARRSKLAYKKARFCAAA
jgi:hypothetical protein